MIDPAKVTRTALQNAASIAGLMLTTEAIISEVADKTSAPAMPWGLRRVTAGPFRGTREAS